MANWLRDAWFGMRLMTRSPVFTVTAVLLLAIGISANTLIFSVVDALLLRPLPVAHPENLVRLIEVHPTGFVTWEFPYGVYEALAARRDGLSEVLAEGDADVALSEGRDTERIRAHFVSPNLFEALGARPYIGRLLNAEDERSGSTNAVLSHDFWERHFHRDRSILGRGVTLQGVSFTVVGVLPRGFNGLTVDTSPDVRVPASADRLIGVDWGGIDAYGRKLHVQIFGRLAAGTPLERADARMEPELRATYDDLLRKMFPEDAPANSSITSTKLHLEPIANGVSALRAQFSRGLEVLMAGVGLLLFMACANVAGLLLARATVRSPEMAVRRALGAGRGRIARQLFTESFLLAVIGGIAGTALTFLCQPLLLRSLPPVRDRAAVMQRLAVHIDIDLRVLSFTLLITMLAAILFGLSPAVAGARIDLVSALRSSRTATRRGWIRSAIVMAQVALCTLLLIGAALLVETLDRLHAMNIGFEPDRLVTFTVDPGMKNYKPEQARELSRKLLERVQQLPAVESAGIAARPLMRGTGVKTTYGPEGTRLTRNDFLNTSLNSITPGYFETMGIRLLAGRDFTWFDGESSKPPHKVIVNQTLARRFFPGQDPIGRRIGRAGGSGVASGDNEIIGVVSDSKYRSLREPVPPVAYSPVVKGFEDAFVLHVRTRQRPEAVIGPVREAMRRLDPQMPFVEVHAMREEVETSLWQERLLASLASIFGAIAALLAGIGLYGALDYGVKSRTREIGVRVALGAAPSRVAGMLTREVLLLVACGVAFGIVSYAVAAPYIGKVLYEVPAWDGMALGSTLLLIVITGTLAAAAPIWRGVRIEPAPALRQE